MSVTADEILGAARARQAALTAETAGYLVLAVADAFGDAATALDLCAVHLNEDGSVSVPRPKSSAADSLVGDLRNLLANLLAHASPGPPALGRVASSAQTAPLRRFVSELEAALIPVNRSAARRALSRLQRDVVRALRQGMVAAPSAIAAPPASPPKPPESRPPPLAPVAVEEKAPAPSAVTAERTPVPSVRTPEVVVATPKLPPELLEEVPSEPSSARAPEIASVDPVFRPPERASGTKHSAKATRVISDGDLSRDRPSRALGLAPSAPPPPSSISVPTAAVRRVYAQPDSLVETLVPPTVALASRTPANPPAEALRAPADLEPIAAPMEAVEGAELEATPFLGSLEVVLRARGPLIPPFEALDGDTERLPPVNWADVDADADEKPPGIQPVRREEETSLPVPDAAPEPASIEEPEDIRASLPVPKSWIPVPPVVRALRVSEVPADPVEDAAPAPELSASPAYEKPPEPAEAPIDAAVPIVLGSLFDLSDAAFANTDSPEPSASVGAAMGEARQSLLEAHESLLEARETLLEAWEASSAVHARVAPCEPAETKIEAPPPEPPRSAGPPSLYRPRQSDVHELLSEFVVAEAKSLRDLARELKSMAGVYVTPAPPPVLPITSEEIARRR